MAYTKQTWADKPATSSPLSAARLNHIEDGISANDEAITALNNNLTENYALKTEVTNCMTPKGNCAYASLPTTGNTIGDYYYCADGDTTHGAGNYVWNGTAWYFGGTGDEGYSTVKGILDDLGLSVDGDGYVVQEVEDGEE